jgi:DNA alkylation damage repair protein AlkB
MSFPEGETGLRLYPGHIDRGKQAALVAALDTVLAAAPLYAPRMPKSGRPFTVRMSNCGPLGWVSDENGYRYQPTHPENGRPWPPIPAALVAIWNEIAGYPHAPQACLVNFYAPTAKMGLHQDRDEEDFTAPVISVAASARIPPGRFAFTRATSWFWAAMHALLFTAWIGSMPERRPCSGKADGSI